MTPKSAARKRSRPSNGPSTHPDYPSQRAFHAAQRIHQASGMWPTELCKGFVPNTWGIRLMEGLSALVTLAVSAENVTLEEVRRRLKVFALSRSDRPRLSKSDIAKVRKWLRGMGVDTKAKASNRWYPRQADDDDEIGDSDDEDSEPADEIIALGPRDEMSSGEDDEETEVDPDLTDAEEESAPPAPPAPRRARSLSSEPGDMFVPADEPVEMEVDSKPESPKTNGQSGGDSAASRSRSSSNAAEASARARRNIQPPSRLVHDLPQSSVQHPEGSAKRASASSAAPTPPSSQSTQSTQRPGPRLLKKAVASAPGSPKTPMTNPTAAPPSTMRPPQQKSSQTTATAAQNSTQPRPQPRAQPPASVPTIPTPQSARQAQASQRPNSQPSVPVVKTQPSSSAPRAQPSSQPALSRRTSSNSQSSQPLPERRPPAPTTAAPQPSLYSHLTGSQPSTSRPASATGTNKRPAPSSPANTQTVDPKMAVTFSESLTSTSVKRQKTEPKPEVQHSNSQAPGTLDWKSLLPSGNEFQASLEVALKSLQPHQQSFERLLTSIDDEHRRLTTVERTLKAKKEELTMDQQKAQEALKDVETSTKTENKMLKDLEDLYHKHPGDNDLRTFVERRKTTVREHKEVYNIVASQLERSVAGLNKTHSEIAVVSKRLGQLDTERAEVMGEKTGIDTAAKRLMFMLRFMEPGWQERIAMVEEALGEEVMMSAF
ncbi:hypothetical protein F53441_10634 [Fusarium austroafricanum]|uniref:Uncharacterized protein n=1 Tax=Fusarium austroafricanum TaxID=2364996 RepID=A0A8H4P217_9HYPO|nr:hypothetical protein F53441_10634 [Fusarium austroafricanum]